MTPNAHNLVETAITLVEQTLKDNFESALSNVRTYRTDAAVATPQPMMESYFIFERPKIYNAPGVILISPGVDFRKSQVKANHINAKVKVHVSIVVEDKELRDLTLKAWRYQAAAHAILEQARLTSGDGAVTLTVVVTEILFSPEYTESGKGDAREAFRKEVVLVCECEHYERN